MLLQHSKFVSHPHIVKMIGYCYENEKLSVVYNLDSLDILYNLISKGIVCHTTFQINLCSS